MCSREDWKVPHPPPGGLSWKEAPSLGKQSFGPSPGSANDRGRGEVRSSRPGVSFPSPTRIAQEGGITRGLPRTGCGIPHCHCPRSGCGIPVPHCHCPGNFHAGKVVHKKARNGNEENCAGHRHEGFAGIPLPLREGCAGHPPTLREGCARRPPTSA